jgi:hypothetical protein
MAGNVVAACFSPPSRTELIVWSSEIFSHKANVTSLCFLSLSLCNSLRRHPIFLARVFARVFKFRRFIYFLPLPARKRGMLCCAACIVVYYTPSPTASLSFCSIFLSLSLYSFSPTTSRLRIEKDGMGEANEEKFPKRKCSPLFPFAWCIFSQDPQPGSAKKWRGGGIDSNVVGLRCMDFVLGKILKKKTQKVEVTSRGESEMKDVLSCNFQTFGFSVSLLSNC